MSAQYSYIGLSGEVLVLADTSINFRGAWSGSTSYAVRDAASYNGRWFIAITAHTGVTPPSQFVITVPTYWSPLVLVEGDPQIADTNSEIAANNAVALATQALNTTWAGTAVAAAAASLAATGTDAANQAYSLAQQALNTSWTGTDSASQAYSLATTAINTAWTGTGAAATAQSAADSAYSLAQYALDTAWAGTQAAAPLSFASPGTHVCFVSATRGGPNDVEVGILNGVVTSFTQT